MQIILTSTPEELAAYERAKTAPKPITIPVQVNKAVTAAELGKQIKLLGIVR